MTFTSSSSAGRSSVRAPAHATALIAAMILCAAAASAVHADSATLVGPSIAQAHQAATFNGSKFAPNTAVTVMITSPSGQEAGYSAVVDAQGRLVYAFTPTEEGLYALRVVAGKGTVLATSNVFSRR